MRSRDAYLDALLERLHGDQTPPPIAMLSQNNAASLDRATRPPADGAVAVPSEGPFLPLAPRDWATLKLIPAVADDLLLRALLNRGCVTGHELAEQIAIPFGLISGRLQQLKQHRLVVLRDSAKLGDYLYQLTENGLEAALRSNKQCSHDGAAPVPLEDYVASVHAQSIRRFPPSVEAVTSIFSDLVLAPEVVDQIGQAICAGQGFFLYGESGNGKTSIAERVAGALGSSIWIPRCITVDGTIIRLFDPCNHIEHPLQQNDGICEEQQIDRRWVRIRRPTILVGGELTMERLEIRPSAAQGVHEAPLQMKSNGGTLVIDDFGRQRMGMEELLNRWIVPLDRQYDFFSLPSGRTIQVPFDQLLVFSSNYPPARLADDAFLRRLPYKIKTQDPTEAQFQELFRREAAAHGLTYDQATVDQLIETHYRSAGRPLRCCHPRDLLKQVRHYCEFRRLPYTIQPEYLAAAVRSYFAMSS